MKRFAQMFVIAIAVTTVFASIAAAGTVIPNYLDDESGYQIYRNLGGEMDQFLATEDLPGRDIQDEVDQMLVWAFSSAEYQTSEQSCSGESRPEDALAMQKFEIFSENNCVE